MIVLKPLNDGNRDEITALRVSEEQKAYVSDNTLSIQELQTALAHGGKAFAFGIYDDDTPVGFVMIGFGTDDAWENPPEIAKDNYSLWRIMIDHRFQGKGCGTAAMRAVTAFIRSFPCGPARYCWTSYDPANTAAKHLYQSFGFEQTDEYDDDEVIAVCRL